MTARQRPDARTTHSDVDYLRHLPRNGGMAACALRSRWHRRSLRRLPRRGAGHRHRRASHQGDHRLRRLPCDDGMAAGDARRPRQRARQLLDLPRRTRGERDSTANHIVTTRGMRQLPRDDGLDSREVRPHRDRSNCVRATTAPAPPAGARPTSTPRRPASPATSSRPGSRPRVSIIRRCSAPASPVTTAPCHRQARQPHPVRQRLRDLPRDRPGGRPTSSHNGLDDDLRRPAMTASAPRAGARRTSGRARPASSCHATFSWRPVTRRPRPGDRQLLLVPQRHDGHGQARRPHHDQPVRRLPRHDRVEAGHAGRSHPGARHLL